ncbi:peroxiredoxin, partial [candidate division KSB1 bacterium]|nr:peroxiredoxin [candidate division KSB1 bacterium]
YFYPKDDTPGCTKEACSFRDFRSEIEKHEAVIIGVSADGAESHQRFIKKYDLTFPLLSDSDHQVAEAYGAWGEKNMYGKKYFGMIRKTFIIDKNGKIVYANHKVKADGHGEEILQVLKEF